MAVGRVIRLCTALVGCTQSSDNDLAESVQFLQCRASLHRKSYPSDSFLSHTHGEGLPPKVLSFGASRTPRGFCPPLGVFVHHPPSNILHTKQSKCELIAFSTKPAVAQSVRADAKREEGSRLPWRIRRCLNTSVLGFVLTTMERYKAQPADLFKCRRVDLIVYLPVAATSDGPTHITQRRGDDRGERGPSPARMLAGEMKGDGTLVRPPLRGRREIMSWGKCWRGRA